MELRHDPLSGVPVQVVDNRQRRPNLPEAGCPFCVGGTEAPEPYLVKAFPNRWPPLPGDRCEVLLYAPDHAATLTSVSPEQVRRVVDLWADRTAELGRRDDVEYVLVFENHGPEVGATISHPHGQLYAFDHVPPVPGGLLSRLADGHPLLEDRPDLVVVEREGFRAWVPSAPVYPFGMRVAPVERRPDLPSLDPSERDAFGSVLTEALARLEGVFDPPMPYLFWIHQRPSGGGEWPEAWLHVEIAGPHRAPGLMRFVAAAELATGLYQNPVVPEDAAHRLREVEVDRPG